MKLFRKPIISGFLIIFSFTMTSHKAFAVNAEEKIIFGVS